MTTQSKGSAPSSVPAAAATLAVDLVCDAGDWSLLGDAERALQNAADAVALYPGLLKFGPSEVSVALSSDAIVSALNGQFRGRSKPTNVLSFPAGHGAPAEFLGDIILAEETVLQESAEQGTSVVHHVQHLVVHGILHLIGYDHETPAEAERMEALEISILARLGIANPYTGELDIAKKE